MALFDQLGFTFQAPPRRVWTVRDLLASVRTHLEREYTDVWVEGEISNFRPAESGHLYFSLKEGDTQLRVVMFRLQARLLRFRPENGMQVLARGRVTIYEGRGEMQLSAEFLEPKGAGALQVAFEQLKAKLAAEGLFDAARKKPLPALPRRIGIITSPRGAAVQDVLNILRRRHESVHVLIYPAQVQGPSAAGEVAGGVRYFNRAAIKPDVILIARGGGSLEDLAAFNHETLARVVADSKIPVISAIGHETDFTIVDFVADLRAPTPSAAAELVIRSKEELEEQVTAMRSRLERGMRYRVLMARHALSQLAQHGAFTRVRQLLNRRQQQLDDLGFRLAAAERERLLGNHRKLENQTARLQQHDPRRRLAQLNREADRRTAALATFMRGLLAKRGLKAREYAARLEALSPLKVLERGYALVFDAAGNLVKDAAQLSAGDEITARLARGSVQANITGKS